MVCRRWLAPGAHGQRRAEPLPAVELAELAFYSLVDGGAALARGGEQPRLLTFRSGGLTIEVEMIGAGRDRRVVGQLVPPRPARVEVRGAASAVEVTAYDLGRFAADAPG